MKVLWTMLALIGGAVLMVGCSHDASSKPAKMNVVDMNGLMRFSPAEIKVRVGDTVHWKNTSLVAHTVTADPTLAKKPGDVQLPAGAAPFNSGNIDPGKSWDYTFNVAGTYKYFCIPHESMGMVGKVIVSPATSTAHTTK